MTRLKANMKIEKMLSESAKKGPGISLEGRSFIEVYREMAKKAKKEGKIDYSNITPKPRRSERRNNISIIE